MWLFCSVCWLFFFLSFVRHHVVRDYCIFLQYSFKKLGLKCQCQLHKMLTYPLLYTKTCSWCLYISSVILAWQCIIIQVQEYACSLLKMLCITEIRCLSWGTPPIFHHLNEIAVTTQERLTYNSQRTPLWKSQYQQRPTCGSQALFFSQRIILCMPLWILHAAAWERITNHKVGDVF